MPYDAQFEHSIRTFRGGWRLLVAKGINYNVPPEYFKAACLARLSNPGIVTFFWPPIHRPWYLHAGSVMIGFPTQGDSQMAEGELQGGFEHRRRQIIVERAGRRARRPGGLQAMQSAAAIPTAPAVAPAVPAPAAPAPVPVSVAPAPIVPTPAAPVSVASAPSTPALVPVHVAPAPATTTAALPITAALTTAAINVFRIGTQEFEE